MKIKLTHSIFLCLAFIYSSFVLKAQEKDLDKIFSAYEIVTYEIGSTFDKVKLLRDHVHHIRIAGYDMELYENDLLSDQYQFITSSNVRHNVNKRAVPMKGFTKDGKIVSLTIGSDFIFGFVQEEDEKIYFESARLYDKSLDNNVILSYSNKNIIDTSPGSCGANMEAAKRVDQRMRDSGVQMRAGNCYTVEYAIVHDFLMYNDFGNNSSDVENFGIGVTNDINTNYDTEFADEIKFVITGQQVFTSAGTDPFTASTSADNFLNSFTNWAQNSLNISHDVASCWTGRDFDGSTIGLAWVGVICTSLRYNVLQYNPNYSQAVTRVLTAHEIGHNFNASHDGSGSNTIMAPSVNSSNTWSSASISSIESHYSSRSCLAFCASSPGTVSFVNSASTVSESMDPLGTGGMCGMPYSDITRTVTITNLLNNAPVTVGVNITGGDADDMDFQLLTNQITFSQGNLSQEVVIRIFNDLLEEEIEDIEIQLNILSGVANLGSASHVLSISNIEDQPYTGTGSSEEYIQFGEPNVEFPAIFRNLNTDSRFRFIINATDLESFGLTEGYIDQIFFYVYSKFTTQSFQNFRIGITSVNETYLNVNTPYYSTTEIFYGNFETTTGWFGFQFDVPYYWDGTSSLYIETCMDMNTTIGYDRILGYNNPNIQGYPILFAESNSIPGCNLGTNFAYSSQPLVLFRKMDSGPDIEELVNNSGSTYLQVGETAHYYSDAGNIIASVKNIGNQNIECLNVSIDHAGTGKRFINFNGIQITDKSFHVETENNAYYEATFYYKANELGTWNNGNNLHFVKSSVPFENANSNNSQLLFEKIKDTNIGGSGNKSYQVVGKGDGYYALTDSYDSDLATRLDQSDIIFHEANNGVILQNEEGASFLISLNGSGNLVAGSPSAAVLASTNDGDVYLGSSSNSLIFKLSNGGYRQVSIGDNGMLSSASISSLPGSSIDFMTGSLSLGKTYSGIIMQSPSGQCWKVHVNAVGEISASSIDCP